MKAVRLLEYGGQLVFTDVPAPAIARDEILVISPRPGQSVEPTAETPQEHWWPALPWRTGAQNPIVAHHGD